MTAIYEERMQTPDKELIARCLHGDMEAFRQVYALYERPVLRYAYYLLGHHEDAADVKQETFLRAYQSLATFRNTCSLQSWLLKICVNLCRDRIRSRKHRPIAFEETRQDGLNGDLPLPDPYQRDPYQAVERAQTVQTILRALYGLPPTHREILVLHEIEGLGYPEIARILGCSAPTAKMRLFRARHCLKERVSALLARC